MAKKSERNMSEAQMLRGVLSATRADLRVADADLRVAEAKLQEAERISKIHNQTEQSLTALYQREKSEKELLQMDLDRTREALLCVILREKD